MKWKSSDYDCRNVFVNTISVGLKEPNKFGFTHFFSLIDEYLNISEKLSSEVVNILQKAKLINRDLPTEKLISEIKKIYDDFKYLDM